MKEYSESLMFDNETGEENGSDSGFCLESLVRSAAQRMIQGALEAEVTEFLGRLPGEKSERSEGFRGIGTGIT